MLGCLLVAGSAEIEILVEAGKIFLRYSDRKIQDTLFVTITRALIAVVQPSAQANDLTIKLR
ncbi:hypothetical protein A9R01_02570 ['Osedax' symbiont bacterium Rs2_46_30_T18]|nr:hypothetical protein A9R01_02570 ['Osedax' symbiont bacterium Rs2_46_30_T18]